MGAKAEVVAHQRGRAVILYKWHKQTVSPRFSIRHVMRPPRGGSPVGRGQRSSTSKSRLREWPSRMNHSLEGLLYGGGRTHHQLTGRRLCFSTNNFRKSTSEGAISEGLLRSNGMQQRGYVRRRPQDGRAVEALPRS
jgi:hypothetical protein